MFFLFLSHDKNKGKILLYWEHALCEVNISLSPDLSLIIFLNFLQLRIKTFIITTFASQNILKIFLDDNCNDSLYDDKLQIRIIVTMIRDSYSWRVFESNQFFSS